MFNWRTLIEERMNTKKVNEDQIWNNIKTCVDLLNKVTESMSTFAGSYEAHKKDWNLYLSMNNEALESIRNRLDKLERARDPF